MSMMGYLAAVNDIELAQIRFGRRSAGDFFFGEDSEPVEMNKAWHTIHFVLCSGAWGRDSVFLSLAILGGQPAGEEEVGYGPVIYLTADLVKEVHASLQKVTKEAFHKLFSLRELRENQVYPILDPEEDEEDFFSFVWSYMEVVKAFYADAAREGKNRLLCIA